MSWSRLFIHQTGRIDSEPYISARGEYSPVTGTVPEASVCVDFFLFVIYFLLLFSSLVWDSDVTMETLEVLT